MLHDLCIWETARKYKSTNVSWTIGHNTAYNTHSEYSSYIKSEIRDTVAHAGGTPQNDLGQCL